jgi:taurine dioxygenase
MFGPLHFHPAAPHLDGYPPIFVIHAHRDSKVANGEGWHTDVSCDAEPPMATMLQLHKLPSAGGDTMFASMYAAYEALSPAMQQFLQTLTASHESEHVYRGRYSDRGIDDKDKVYPSSVHPVVRTHPETGRRALYVNRGFTTKINELSKKESETLLKFLFGHMEEPFFQVRFKWSVNDVALWDNRCLQHRALWDYWPEERKGHRVTIKGDRPYLDA